MLHHPYIVSSKLHREFGPKRIFEWVSQKVGVVNDCIKYLLINLFFIYFLKIISHFVSKAIAIYRRTGDT